MIRRLEDMGDPKGYLEMKLEAGGPGQELRSQVRAPLSCSQLCTAGVRIEGRATMALHTNFLCFVVHVVLLRKLRTANSAARR